MTPASHDAAGARVRPPSGRTVLFLGVLSLILLIVNLVLYFQSVAEYGRHYVPMRINDLVIWASAVNLLLGPVVWICTWITEQEFKDRGSDPKAHVRVRIGWCCAMAASVGWLIVLCATGLALAVLFDLVMPRIRA